MPEGAPSARDAKAVLFVLGDMRCMVSADRVVRIDGAQSITRGPLLPPEVAGIVVLGGKVIPVLALRSMFDLPAQAEGELVVVNSGTGNYVLLVDRVLWIGASGGEQQEALLIDVDALVGRVLAKRMGSRIVVVERRYDGKPGRRAQSASRRQGAGGRD